MVYTTSQNLPGTTERRTARTSIRITGVLAKYENRNANHYTVKLYTQSELDILYRRKQYGIALSTTRISNITARKLPTGQKQDSYSVQPMAASRFDF